MTRRLQEALHVVAASAALLATLIACKAGSSRPDAAPIGPADFSKINIHTIAIAARASGYPKSVEHDTGGDASVLGWNLEYVSLENPRQGVVDLRVFQKTPTTAFRVDGAHYIRVAITEGQEESADDLLTGLLKSAPIGSITRRDVGEYLRAHGWSSIQNLSDEIDPVTAEKDDDTLEVEVELSGCRGVSASDASHFMCVETADGREANEKVLRAIVAP